MSPQDLLIAWRDARQAIFDVDTTKADLPSLLTRLATAEHALMAHARTLAADMPVADVCSTCHGRREIEVPVTPPRVQTVVHPVTGRWTRRDITTTIIDCPDCRRSATIGA